MHSYYATDNHFHFFIFYFFYTPDTVESAEDAHDKDPVDGGCGLRPVPLLQLQLPGSKPMYQPYKGQLQLSIYYYDGIITVHGEFKSWGDSALNCW